MIPIHKHKDSSHLLKQNCCGFCNYCDGVETKKATHHYCKNKQNNGYQIQLWFSCLYFKKKMLPTLKSEV